MITFDNEHMKLFIHADGKQFRVTAICNYEKEANDYCKANPDEGVIAVDRQYARIYIAEDKETYAKIGPSNPMFPYVQARQQQGLPVCDSADHNDGCTNPGCPVWGKGTTDV